MVRQNKKYMKIQEYQENVEDWTKKCFGENIATNIRERNYRFLEEALELVQSGGISKEESLALVDYVFERPSGVIEQEVGGVIVTLAALCSARGISLENSAANELNRINGNMEKIRDKHNAKKLRIA
jgi:hypothetical protein